MIQPLINTRLFQHSFHKKMELEYYLEGLEDQHRRKLDLNKQNVSNHFKL